VYHRAVRLILASSSPRRADLLAAAGYEFLVAPCDVDERPLSGELPRAYVIRVAEEKARAAQTVEPSDVVLAADTTVALGDDILGKPADEAEAAAMLRRLAGREHLVHTGVAVRRGSGLISGAATTRVRFLQMSEAEIGWYVASGEADGKAGAYGIQGRAGRFVDWIEGSYSNVVGLPMHLVHGLLTRAGYPLADPVGPAR
jgi:septum formation protein